MFIKRNLDRAPRLQEVVAVIRHSRYAVFLIAFTLPLWLGCGANLPDYDYSQEPDPRTREFVLGINDGLRIHVWDNPGLSTEATVRPDGTITMPLVGDLTAAGKTPSELREAIREQLTDYLKVENSSVTVAVTTVNSYRFMVSGEVARPGIHSSQHYVTVAEAIALAGGFTRFASKDSIILQRRDPDTNEVRQIPIAYRAIASGEHPEMNLVLLAGDSLHVP
jgi:polysaccharide biosynthesis/export protein